MKSRGGCPPRLKLPSVNDTSDGLRFPSESLWQVNHVIVDQDGLPRTVVSIQHHLSALCHPNRGGGVFRRVAQEFTVAGWPVPVAVVQINSIESHDTHFFISPVKLPLQ